MAGRCFGVERGRITEGLLWLILLGAYFLPAIVAAARGHQNAGAIFLLHLFLGWTLVGWVAALVWAATTVKTPTARASAAVEEATKKCPICAERVKSQAVRCHFCGYSFPGAAPAGRT